MTCPPRKPMSTESMHVEPTQAMAGQKRNSTTSGIGDSTRDNETASKFANNQVNKPRLACFMVLIFNVTAEQCSREPAAPLHSSDPSSHLTQRLHDAYSLYEPPFEAISTFASERETNPTLLSAGFLPFSDFVCSSKPILRASTSSIIDFRNQKPTTLPTISPPDSSPGQSMRAASLHLQTLLGRIFFVL